MKPSSLPQSLFTAFSMRTLLSQPEPPHRIHRTALVQLGDVVYLPEAL